MVFVGETFVTDATAMDTSDTIKVKTMAVQRNAVSECLPALNC